jgi:hypothetical protein
MTAPRRSAEVKSAVMRVGPDADVDPQQHDGLSEAELQQLFESVVIIF